MLEKEPRPKPESPESLLARGSRQTWRWARRARPRWSAGPCRCRRSSGPPCRRGVCRETRPRKQERRKKYFASSNPHPPHSRAYDRYNKFLRILETSTPNSHRPLPNEILPRKNGEPYPPVCVSNSTCLRADLENSNIGSVNKKPSPFQQETRRGIKRSCLHTTQSTHRSITLSEAQSTLKTRRHQHEM